MCNHNSYYYTVFVVVRTPFPEVILQKSRDLLMLHEAGLRKPAAAVVRYELLKKAERLQRIDLTTTVTGILWRQGLSRWGVD